MAGWSQARVDAVFYALVGDLAGAPQEIIDPHTGQVEGRSIQSLYGQRAWTGGVSSPLLFAGQYLDAESGWAYNRFRFYSPVLAGFNAQDPLGLAPRIASAQGYVDHAAYWVDVLGLFGCERAALIDAKVGTTDGGPGVWERVDESMSDRARAYQESVAGAPSEIGYRINGVKFDGFREGTLIDAKGPGYAQFLKPDGSGWHDWFTGGISLEDQAIRQVFAANGTPIQWIVQEPATASYPRKSFARTGLPIEVIQRN